MRKVWVEDRGSRTYRLRWHNMNGTRGCLTIHAKNKQDLEACRRECEQDVNTPKGLRASGRTSFSEFLRVLETNFAPMKSKAYWLVLKGALKRLRQYVGTTLESVTAIAVDRMVTQLIKEGIRTTTANKITRHCACAFGKAVEWGMVQANPFTGRAKLREPERDIHVLSDEDEARLYNACARPGIRALMHRCILHCALDGGLRAKEIANVQIHLDYSCACINIRNRDQVVTKSGRQRVVFVSIQHRKDMARLQRVTKKRKPFPFFNGNARSVSDAFARIARRAQVRITLHDLRRTCISRMANAGGDIQAVQRYAGHADIKTTLRFYTRIEHDTLKNLRESTDMKRNGNG